MVASVKGAPGAATCAGLTQMPAEQQSVLTAESSVITIFIALPRVTAGSSAAPQMWPSNIPRRALNCETDATAGPSSVQKSERKLAVE